MINTHDLGDLVRVIGVWRDVATGNLIDPTAVKLSILKPTGALATYIYGGVDGVVKKDSVGNYHADLNADQAGGWFYRWCSTGTGQAAKENKFQVREAVAV